MDILVIALTAWKSQEWMAEKQKEASDHAQWRASP